MPLTRSAAGGRPRQEEFALAGRAHHDRDGENDGSHGEQAVLRREPDRDGLAGFLVGFEANIGTGSVWLQGHCVPFPWFGD